MAGESARLADPDLSDALCELPDHRGARCWACSFLLGTQRAQTSNTGDSPAARGGGRQATAATLLAPGRLDVFRGQNV